MGNEDNDADSCGDVFGTHTLKEPGIRDPWAFRRGQRRLVIKQEFPPNYLFDKNSGLMNMHCLLENIHFHQFLFKNEEKMFRKSE